MSTDHDQSWEGEADLAVLAIDHQLVRGCLLDWQIGWFNASENFVYVNGGAAMQAGKYPPAKPGALRLGPPGAADGVADAAPKYCATSGWRSTLEVELLQSLILLFLVADILADDCLVTTDSRYEVASRPEVLPNEVAFTLAIDPRQVDGALALDEPDHL